MSKLSDLRTRLGITEDDFQTIIAVYYAAAAAGFEGADVVPDSLNKYEKEIVRLQEINDRLRNKNRNYRTGMKQLQRAHEATLHQLAAVKDTSEQYRAVAQEMAAHGGCQLVYVDEESDAPYSPVRFNNEITDYPVERQSELAKSI